MQFVERFSVMQYKKLTLILHDEMDAVSSLSNGTSYVNPKNVSLDMHASIYVGRNPRHHEQFKHVEVWLSIGPGCAKTNSAKVQPEVQNFF